MYRLRRTWYQSMAILSALAAAGSLGLSSTPCFAGDHDTSVATSEAWHSSQAGHSRESEHSIDSSQRHIGCDNPRQDYAAHVAADAVERSSGDWKGRYHVNGIGVSECVPFSVERLLGKPTPLYIRVPDPVCGVALYFESRADEVRFLQDMWRGKILAGRAQRGVVRIDSDDDSLLDRKQFVTVCPDVLGNVVPEGKLSQAK